LPKGIVYEWTELTYQEILAGNSAALVFPALDPAGVPGARCAVRNLALPLSIILTYRSHCSPR
jgi:multidrug efflux pump